MSVALAEKRRIIEAMKSTGTAVMAVNSVGREVSESECFGFEESI